MASRRLLARVAVMHASAADGWQALALQAKINKDPQACLVGNQVERVDLSQNALLKSPPTATVQRYPHTSFCRLRPTLTKDWLMGSDACINVANVQIAADPQPLLSGTLYSNMAFCKPQVYEAV